MAYKNKKKNKAHISALQNKGWRAADKLQRRKNEFRDSLIGLEKETIELLIKRKFK